MRPLRTETRGEPHVECYSMKNKNAHTPLQVGMICLINRLILFYTLLLTRSAVFLASRRRYNRMEEALC